ncbi:hypothetical protein AAFF_G00333800 [Aldrovandia affinis]|uniref:Uncharacterized protein n=1 Tax=Aldrovandia affinis TaxID=143900 RepID=A0AAD7R6L3_9TELE|nr:hypothetical protein AAFF_G00333800 [Aldrovandia affinis]
MQRKRLRAEEYKMEEQKQRKEQEKAARLEEERSLAQEQELKQKFPQDMPSKIQEIKEQRQLKEQEKAAWLAEERAEERRQKQEREFKQWNFPHDTLGKRPEDTVKPVETHAAMATTQSSRYAHNLSGLLDPAQLELIQRKRVRDEEYRHELDTQMEEQRQQREKEKAERLAQERVEERVEEQRLSRGKEFKQRNLQQDVLCNRQQRDLVAQIEEQKQQKEQEKAARLAEERAEEQMVERRQKRDFKQWKFPYDTLGKRPEDTVKPEELRAAMGTTQSSRYAHNLSGLLDPAQLELIQRKRVRDEEYRHELDMQIEEQRQQREKEKAERMAQERVEERAEEQRLSREKEFKQQNPRQDVLCKRQQQDLNVPKEPQRQRCEKDKVVCLPEEQVDKRKLSQEQDFKQPKFQQDTIAKREDRNLTQCNILGQRIPVVTRRSSNISRQLHSTDREYISPKDGVMPTLMMVVPTVPCPTACHVENRQRSPPVPVLQRKLQEQSSACTPPSEGTTEADQTNSPAPSPQSGDPVRKASSPTPMSDLFLHDDRTKQVVVSGLSQLLQGLQAIHRELEMAV